MQITLTLLNIAKTYDSNVYTFNLNHNDKQILLRLHNNRNTLLDKFGTDPNTKFLDSNQIFKTLKALSIPEKLNMIAENIDLLW